jgi:hypothetical protein
MFSGASVRWRRTSYHTRATVPLRFISASRAARGARAWKKVLQASIPPSTKLFVEQLDDHELAILERALGKVILDCSFG